MKTIVFLSLVATAAALSCGTCEREKCPTLSCQGGVVDDACVCCKECAKLDGQSCGGPFNKYGQCDSELVCELIVAVGDSLNPDAHGICRDVQKTDSDVTGSFTESSQDSQDSSYILECEIKSFSGCNLVNEKCACSENVRTCINPFQFADLVECRQVVRVQNGSIIPEPTPADCSQARCEIVFDIHCPTDSLKIEAQRGEGECCPRPPQCLCDMGSCHDVICAEGYMYHEIAAGNGRPGSCCDTYECRPIMDPNHCNGVVCPDSNEEMCPEDSKAVMGGMSDDGCCILPSRCSCALERCTIPVCSQGYSPRRIASGNTEPGSCCDVYECVVGIVTEGCTHHEHTYTNGESWTVGHCKTCRCESSWAHCIVQQDCNPEENQLCLTSHGIKMHGEKWDEDDCTMCECVDGTSACMTSSCVVRCLNPRTVPGICCPVCDTVTNFITMHPIGCPPPQSNCTLLCPHGYDKDENECPVCQCLPEPTPTTSRVVSTTLSPSEVSATSRQEPAAGTTSMTTPTSTHHIEIVCPLIDCVESCSNGYVTDKHGCSLCDCLPEISVCEDMAECTRKCPFGFRQDDNGCDTCRCQQCKPMDSCTKSCLYGYQMGRHGCLKCKCRKCPPLTDCKKLCTHGLEINDRGCEICKCQASAVLDPKPSIPAEGSCQALDGLVYDDGESWHDGCRQCYCSNGQEMCSLITCQVPACSKPVIRPDQCCPTCPDSGVTQPPAVLSQVCQSASGQYYIEGETWMLGRCTSCMCHAGQVLCSPEVCPPLPCVNPVFRASRCCAECDEILPELPISDPTREDSCMLPGGVTFQHGATWKDDSCTSCQCVSGETMCFSQTCPPVDCDKPLLKKGQCCPTCLDPETRLVCKSGGDVYVSGETWRVDNCTTCVCEGSRVSCTISHCPVLKCENLVHVPGTCCPICQDEDILVYQTKQPTKVSHTDKKDFDATEPAPSPDKPKTQKPYRDKEDSNLSEQRGDVETPIAAKHHPFPVYPVVMSILVILLAICIVLLLLLFVTKRRHRLLYHVNIKPIGVKGQPPPAIATTAVKTKNTGVKNSNSRDSIRDSAMFKDNLPSKTNSIVLDGKDIKRHSDMFAVGKSIQPV